MVFVREFEFYESDGCMLACPCDMEGGTFGNDSQVRNKIGRRK